MLADQGACLSLNLNSPANNIFSNCNGNNYEIYQSPQVPNFGYYSPYDIVLNCSNIGASYCSFEYDEIESCPAPPSYPCPSCVNELISQYAEADGTVKDQIKAELIRALQVGEEGLEGEQGDIEAILDLLADSGQPDDIKLLVQTYAERYECEQGRYYLEQIERTSTENEQFYQFYNIFVTACEEDRTKDELTDDELLLIEEYSGMESPLGVYA